MKHIEVVQSEFAKQAGSYGRPGYTIAREDLLAWMVACLPLNHHCRVLDVAAGTGILSRALAPLVGQVTAIDATAEMLGEGKRLTRQAGISNLVFEQGIAEQLPHGDGAFDLVTCRLAVHHLLCPQNAVAEMARVCKPGGAVALMDLVSPDNAQLAAVYNVYERFRDPSHTVALTHEGLAALLTTAGLKLVRSEARECELVAEQWLSLTKTDRQVAERIKDHMLRDIAGQAATGMRPFVKDGKLMFLHTWHVVVGQK